MQRLTRFWIGVVLASAMGACGFVSEKLLGLPPYTHQTQALKSQMVVMRDGVKLNTDIYLPEGEGPFPAILIRNPYNMGNVFKPVNQFFARYGYAVVHQDTRGRFASEGEWLPLLNERNDGLDTLAWLRQQPWQNGNIALFGGSYLSAVIWAVADQLPPEVKTIVLMIISTDLRGVLYEKGMFRHEVFTFWAALMPDNSMDVFNGVDYQKAIRHFPPIALDRKYLGHDLPWFREWQMSVSEPSRLWQLPEAQLLKRAPELVEVPVLMLSGWYDLFNKGQLKDFARLKTRAQSRIIIGPWTHLMGLAGDGELDFTDAGSVLDQMPLVLNWLDHHLRGATLDAWGPVKFYSIGDSTWREAPAWPPATESLYLYFRRAGQAWSCTGGLLTAKPGQTETSASYDYDPRNPTPSRGGEAGLAFVMAGWGGVEPSVRSQSGLCERDDVLTFLTPPLRRDLEIAGAVKVTLSVASTAEDTAFAAKLIAVDERGRAYNIRSGITSLAYRNHAATPQSYVPGQKVDVTIDLWPIQWRLPAGHRLRLDISSADFPMYAAHGNRAEPWALLSNPQVARQTIYFGGSNASRIEIPVALE